MQRDWPMLDGSTSSNRGRGARFGHWRDTGHCRSGRQRSRRIVRDVARFGFPLPEGGTLYQLAHERPGRYIVRVVYTDYLPWERSDIRVSRGDCHVRTAELSAHLQGS